MDQRGLTLVDTVIASALLIVVFGLAIPGFKLAEDTISTGGARDRLERTGDRILGEILPVVRSGRIASVAPPGGEPSIAVHPVRTDLVLDDFTAEDPDPYEAEPVVISFRTVRTITESELRTDLNRDGDREDSYALGTIEIAAGDRTRVVSARPEVLLGLPSYEGDLDGDGQPDPLFSSDGNRVFVNLRLVCFEPGGRALLASRRNGIRPRNHQEPR